MYSCQPSASSNFPWALPGPERVLCWGAVLRWSAARPRLSSHTSNSLTYYCSSSFQVFFFFFFSRHLAELYRAAGLVYKYIIYISHIYKPQKGQPP